MTPINESGNVQAGRGVKEIWIAAGSRTTRDSDSPVPRFSTTDWPLKMPNDGAVTIVVTPVARFASRSSSLRLTLRAARYAADVSGNGAGAACERAAAPPPPRRPRVDDGGCGKPSDVCASMRPGYT